MIFSMRGGSGAILLSKKRFYLHIQPMNKPKKQSPPVEHFGRVKVKTEIVTDSRSGNSRTRYRSYCTKSIVPKKYQRREWDTYDEAVQFATELNAAITSGRINKFDPDENQELREIAEQFRMTKLLEKGNSDYWGHETTYREIFELGALFFQAMQNNNAKRKRNGLGKKMPRSTIREFHTFLDEQSDKAVAPTFKELINICVEAKTGKHGGAGNEEIANTTKREWKRYIENELNLWIGHYSIMEERKVLIKAVKYGLNKGVETRKGRDFGKAWGTRSKYNRAKKISEFAKWCVDHEEEYLPVNPFRGLAKQFKPKQSKRAKIFKVSQVKRLFEVLASKDRYKKLIPFYALKFFAGPRSSEVWYVERTNSGQKRRLQWEVFEGWKRKSEVSGGVLFEVVSENNLGEKMSKINVDRTADLPANGVAWIKWALGELPKEGEVYYNRDIDEEVRKEADLWGKDSKGRDKWVDNGARHSMATFADNNADFNTSNLPDYWRDKCGHTNEVFKRDYRGRVQDQAERTAYFNIMPPTNEADRNSASPSEIDTLLGS